MSLTTTNVHGVKSMKLSQRRLVESPETWITVLFVQRGEGDTVEFTMFHPKPMPIEGSEFVNFVAQDPA